MANVRVESNFNNLSNTQPRQLTEFEIEDILSAIPPVASALDEVGHSIREELKNNIREQLLDVLMTPLGIEDLKREITDKFNSSKVKVGSMVGAHAAEAIGQATTQSTLNTFHQSGSARNATYGIDRIRELLNASKKQKTRSLAIYFKDQYLTSNDILINKRPIINDLRVGYLVKGIPDFNLSTAVERPWWYTIQLALFGQIPESSYCLRLRLDVDMLYASKLTMEEVSTAIIDKTLSSGESPIHCVYSPISEGIIDIYAIDKRIPKSYKGIDISSNSVGIQFLQMCVYNELNNIHIRGIHGISQLYPVQLPVLTIVKDQIRQKDNTWKIVLNDIEVIKSGINANHLIRLFSACGFEILEANPNYIVVSFPIGSIFSTPTVDTKTKDGVTMVTTIDSTNPTRVVITTVKNGGPATIVTKTLRPSEYILNVINQVKTDERAQKSEMTTTVGITETFAESEILKASVMVYADTDGTNLRDILSRDDVDPTRTLSNDVHEIKSILGIEAARNFLISEINATIAHEGTYITPRHIVLLVDFMTSLGEVYGITFSGVSRQHIGALAKASFERAMDTFKEASLFGTKEVILGTSASVYIGKKALFGQNYSSDFIDPSIIEKFENELGDITQINPNDYNDAIGRMNNIQYDVDAPVLEGAEISMFEGVTEAYQQIIGDSIFANVNETTTNINPEVICHVSAQNEPIVTNQPIVELPVIQQTNTLGLPQGLFSSLQAPRLTNPNVSSPPRLAPITNPSVSIPPRLAPITNPSVSTPPRLAPITNPNAPRLVPLAPITNPFARVSSIQPLPSVNVDYVDLDDI
jgi:hypothetical protein